MRARVALVAGTAVIICVGCLSRIALSQETGEARPPAVLTKPYTPQLGDMIALTAGQLMTALKSLDTPPTVTFYDRDAKRISVFIYGKKATLDRAKSTLDETRRGLNGLTELVGAIYGVTLKEGDFGYTYYDLSSSQELVRWANGTYTIGEQKEGGQ